MWWAVDLLASEYGGGPRAILEGVYLDELVYLSQKIDKRRANNWYMQAIIASVPFMEKEAKKDFFDNLKKITNPSKTNQLDEGGFEALKLALSQNPKFIVK